MTQHVRRITPRGAAIVLLGVLLFVYLIRLVLLPFVIAGAVALAVSPLTDLIVRRAGASRAWVGAGLFLVILAGVAIPAWLCLPSLLEASADFAAHLEQPLEAALRRLIGTRTVDVLGQPTDGAELAQRVVAALRAWLGDTRNAILLVGGSFALVMGAILSLVLLLYFLTTGPQIGEGLLLLVPPDQRGVARHLWGRMGPILRRYFAGLAIVVLFASGAAYLGIGVALRLPDALPLALATGFLELIPMVGPLASAVLVGMVALHTATGIGGVIAFLIYAVALRLSIDQLIGPIVLGRAARIHPVLVIFCFLTGAALFGIIGVILAVPVALAIKIMLSELYGDPEQPGSNEEGLPHPAAHGIRPPARKPRGPQAVACNVQASTAAGSRSAGRRLRRLLIGVLERRLAGTASFRLAFWDGEVWPIGSAPRVTIRLASKVVFGRLLRGDMTGLGDAYAKGLIDVDGDANDIVAVGLSIAESIGRSRWMSRLARLLELRARHSRRRDAASIAYHYDVSNAFYALWLDRAMVYSCAYFRTGKETLDAAQENKLDHVCRKLRLREGEHLLDIGCGWGGLLIWAARHYGVKATGVTLSRQQYEFCMDRINTEGLQGNVRILFQDYRELEGQGRYDKIASVGMYEHVGIANLPVYFAIIGRLLAPGGVLLNHGICANGASDRPLGPPGGDFIDRHVFPGGELPHLSTLVRGICRSDLELVDIEDLRPHYALTLRHWVRRLEAAAEAATQLGGRERYRTWRLYMAGMAQAFDRGWLTVAQVVALKRGVDGLARRPWTREHVYAHSGLTNSRGFDAATSSGSAHPAP